MACRCDFIYRFAIGSCATFALTASEPALDSSFARAGVATFGFVESNGDRALAAILQGDGKVVTGGTVANGTGSLVRLNADGSVDTSFGFEGSTALALFNSSATRLFALAKQNDGKLVAIVGTASAIYAEYHNAPTQGDNSAIVRLNADGSLNPRKLLDAFLAFWRQHGQPLLKSVSYHEIAPHLVMMAYLDRVANGGGSLTREYAIGSERMDLHLRYGAVQLAIELKVWRDSDKRGDPLARGLEQLDDYLNGLGLDGGWLVIFDQRAGQPDISERTRTEQAVSPAGRNITVIRG